MVAALIVAGLGPAALAQEDVASPRQSLVVYNASSEVEGVPTFGANEPVELLGGFLPVFAGCEQLARNDHGPVVIASSDIIVSKQPDGGSAGFSLTTSVDALGGLNLGTVVGRTQPSGSLPTGLYDVVYDECQDGRYDPVFDAKFTGAFRVIVPVDAPLLDLGAVKNGAQTLVNSIDAWNTVSGKYKKIKAASQDGYEVKEAKKSIEQQILAELGPFGNVLKARKLPGASAEYQRYLRQVAQQIANDPPDPAYAQITIPTPASTDVALGRETTFTADAQFAAASDISSRTAEALLHALERYQGARVAKDGHWSLVHAREITTFANALSAQLTTLNSAVSAAAATYRAEPALDAGVLADLRGTRTGLTATQRTALRNGGFTANEVEAIESALAELDLSTSSSDVAGQLDEMASAAAGWRSRLVSLATASAAIARTLASDPNTGAQPPVASAGGPYSVAAGEQLALSASASTGGVGTLTYRWDTDGDGRYTDATGATPSITAGPLGTRLVSVEVTDSSGQRAYAFVQVSVTGSPTPMPPSSPAGRLQTVDLGQSIDFSVNSDTPVEWQLDGVRVSTTVAYRYAPTSTSQAGVHTLLAVTGRPETGRSVIDWTVLVDAPDSDDDGWRANVDCDDYSDAVNPGRPEAFEDGLDNDCNPATGDGASAAYFTPTAPEVSLTTAADQAVTTTLKASAKSGTTNSSATLTVRSTDNPWLAGQSAIPSAVATDGTIPSDAGVVGGQKVTFTATGTIGCDGTFPGTPDGEGGCPGLQRTNISDLLGISGITSADRSQFLAGVFTNDSERPAPPTALDASSGTGTDFETLSPLLNQLFFIGDGSTSTGVRQEFTVPAGATHLTLGITDAVNNSGVPGAYTGNFGSVSVDLTIKDLGSSLAYAVSSPPGHGTASIVGDQLTYWPNAGFTGPDSFTYVATSTTGGASVQSAPALVHLTVTASASPPVITPIEAITTMGTILTREVTATAPGSPSLTLVAADLPSFATFTDLGSGHGVITVDGARAQPGPYTATMKATSDAGSSSAKVVITVPGDRAPSLRNLTATTAYQTAVTLTAAGSDPDGDALTYMLRTPPAHGSVTQSGTSFTYRPDSGFSGNDAFAIAASDGTLSTSAMAAVAVGGAPSTSAPTLDAVVSADLAGRPTKYISPTLKTTKPNDLLLAFISADGPEKTAQRVSKVTGGSLTWTLASRSTDVWGVAEVWQARATGPFSATVTAIPTKTGYQGSITVAAFTGARSTIGASATAFGRSSHPHVTVTSKTPNSLIWATGHDWDAAKERTPDAGQQVVHQFVAKTVSDTFWTQRVSNPLTTPTPVTVGASASSKSHWQLTAVEIPAG